MKRARNRLIVGLTVPIAVLLAAVTGGCAERPHWRTTALEPGFPALAFELTAASGDLITEAGLRDTVTLLFFGYTSCPDVCPATLATLRAAIETLPDAQQDQIRVLFVSVDPARDDPQRLAAYTGFFGPQFIGATAEMADVRRLASRYGSSFQHDPADGAGHYPVFHGSNVLAFDRAGRARLLIRPDHSAEAIAHDLRRLVTS